jgi:serine protease Do
VVGINTLIISPGEAGNVGLSFSIPINAVKDALPKLKSAKKTSVGWIGAKTQKPDEELRALLKLPKDANGLLVSAVEKQSPAARAGLKELDLILEIEGRNFSEPLEFEQFIQNQDEGKELSFSVWRKGKTLTLKIRVETQK